MSKQVTRLFNQFHPDNYKLALNLDKKALSFTGTVTITGKKVGRPSKRLTFHQKGLKIVDATATRFDKKQGEQPVKLSRINTHKAYDEVRLHSEDLLYPGNYTVKLEFSGMITPGMHGIYPCNYEIDSKKQQWLATQFESHHAREAFPCIDEPEAKATFDLSLNVPKNETAISNMPALSEQKIKDVVNFETTPKMSTYLLAFVIGEMQNKETVTKDGVAVRVWATKAHDPKTLDYGLDVTKRAIEFFNDYYGVPYPLAKSDQIALPDFSSAAMENWGLVTYREPFLLADPATATQSNKETIAMVVCHELSHQWFGNLVTMKWWDDLWLNESFANVMEYVAVDSLFPEWDIWNSFITQEGLAALRRDCIAGVQAVKTAVNHPDEISSLFDPSIVYAKGGRLLNMLMNYIGEKDFRAGLKIYFTKHAYGNTTGDDLWQALSDASGKDIAEFMKPWLERSGFPMVSVSQKTDKLTLSQQHFLLNSTKADKNRLWPVPLLSGGVNVPELLDKASLSVKTTSSEYIQINRGAVGHYIVHYHEDGHLKHLANLAANKKLETPERLMLLSDSSMLARAGVQSLKRTLELLENYAGETSEPVWDIMALTIGDTRRFIDTNPELEKPIKALIRKLIQPQYKRLGWEIKPKEDIQDTKLRALIISFGEYAENPEIGKKVLELFKSYKLKPDSVSPELRAVVLAAVIRRKTPKAFEYLLKLEETTNDVALKPELIGALCLTHSPGEAKILLERLKNPAKVRAHDIDHWLAYLLRNRHVRELAWKWMRDNWGWLEKTFASDKSYDNLPRYAAGAFNSRGLLEEYKKFFEPLKNQPALKRNIEMGNEELENRVTWLERDQKPVSDYFQL